MTRRWQLGLTIALALLALYETVNALTAPWRVPSAADWDAAAAEVRAGFQPGDLIVFAPDWADQIGRQHLGDLVTVEMAGRADDDRYRRVWQVAIRGAHAPDVAGYRAVSENRHGRVTVARYDKPAVEVVYDFTSHVASAHVTSGDRASAVEPRTLEIDYRPRRGILAPAPVGQTLHVEFTDAPLGAKLVGYTGLHDYFSRKNADGPVEFHLFVDGAEKLAVRHGNNDGWRRFEVATTPGTHTVRFDVSAPNPAWRTFGFHCEARK